MWSLRKLTNAFDIRYMYMSFFGDSKNKRILKYYNIYSFNLAGMDE